MIINQAVAGGGAPGREPGAGSRCGPCRRRPWHGRREPLALPAVPMSGPPRGGGAHPGGRAATHAYEGLGVHSLGASVKALPSPGAQGSPRDRGECESDLALPAPKPHMGPRRVPSVASTALGLPCPSPTWGSSDGSLPSPAPPWSCLLSSGPLHAVVPLSNPPSLLLSLPFSPSLTHPSPRTAAS